MSDTNNIIQTSRTNNTQLKKISKLEHIENINNSNENLINNSYLLLTNPDVNNYTIKLNSILEKISENIDNKSIETIEQLYDLLNEYYTKIESDAKYQPKGEYLTRHQDISDKANISDVYNKIQSDAKYQPKGEYLTRHQDLSAYAKSADIAATYQPKGEYLTRHQDIRGKANVGDSYTKAESDAKYQSKGEYLTRHQDISGKVNVGDVYTKSESDAKYQPKGEYLTRHQDIRGKANVGDSYTKAETDTKYQPKGAYLTRHQDISGKVNVGDVYTKSESDTKYQPKGAYLTRHQDISGKVNVGDVYTKIESDTKYQPKGEYLTRHQDIRGKANVGDSYTKAESDAKYQPKGEYLTRHQDLSAYAKSVDIAATYQPKGEYLTKHQNISGKANVGDSYTKDESDAKYQIKGECYTKEAVNNIINNSHVLINNHLGELDSKLDQHKSFIFNEYYNKDFINIIIDELTVNRNNKFKNSRIDKLENKLTEFIETINTSINIDNIDKVLWKNYNIIGTSSIILDLNEIKTFSFNKGNITVKYKTDDPDEDITNNVEFITTAGIINQNTGEVTLNYNNVSNGTKNITVKYKDHIAENSLGEIAKINFTITKVEYQNYLWFVNSSNLNRIINNGIFDINSYIYACSSSTVCPMIKTEDYYVESIIKTKFDIQEIPSSDALYMILPTKYVNIQENIHLKIDGLNLKSNLLILNIIGLESTFTINQQSSNISEKSMNIEYSIIKVVPNNINSGINLNIHS